MRGTDRTSNSSANHRNGVSSLHFPGPSETSLGAIMTTDASERRPARHAKHAPGFAARSIVFLVVPSFLHHRVVCHPLANSRRPPRPRWLDLGAIAGIVVSWCALVACGNAEIGASTGSHRGAGGASTQGTGDTSSTIGGVAGQTTSGGGDSTGGGGEGGFGGASSGASGAAGSAGAPDGGGSTGTGGAGGNAGQDGGPVGDGGDPPVVC